jgi:UDP-glucose 4-epimerase
MTASAQRDDDRETVVVTGFAGRLGQRLTRRLHRTFHVVGIDRRRVSGLPEDVEQVQMDLSRHRLKEVFRRARISALVHLGIAHDPRGPGERQHVSNLAGFQKLMDYAEQFQIPKVVVLSSANVYGPRPDNPQYLTESAPLLAAGAFSAMRGLVEVDMAAQAHVYRRKSTEMVVLRPAHILGTVHNAPSNYLRLKRVPTVLGFDPMVQVVHQDDVLDAIELALAPGARGVYNVAGPASARLSKMLSILGRSQLPVPFSVARLGLEGLFRSKLTSFPTPELDFIRYVCMVDDSKARGERGYQSQRDITQTLHAVDEERGV